VSLEMAILPESQILGLILAFLLKSIFRVPRVC
jgi:hypothetical protein